MTNKILLLLLAALSLSACKESNSDASVGYGMPTAQFTVRGRVTDAKHTPLAGIRILPLEILDISRTDQPQPQQLLGDPIYTSELGSYEIIGLCRFARRFNLVLQIDDIDETDDEETDGTFVPQKDTILITELDRVGASDFLQTFYEKEAEDIVLEELP